MTYQIIDEPKQRKADYLIVPPILILLASIFLPYYIAPIWLLVNSYLLGSPTFRRELIIIIVGSLLLAVFALGSVYLLQQQGEELLERFSPYIRLTSRAGYFFMLYWVIALQNAPYELFNYIREANK